MKVVRQYDDMTVQAFCVWEPLSTIFWEDFLRELVGEELRASIESHFHDFYSVALMRSGLGIHKIVCRKCDITLYEEENLETTEG